MPNDHAKRNSFIVERLPSFIIRDCGTGAGGFKAGNECSKSTGQDIQSVEVVEMESLDYETVYARKLFLTDTTKELNEMGCYGEDCEQGMNDSEIELTDSQKECLFLYSGDSHRDLLKSPTYKWVEPAEKNDISYRDETIEFLRDTGRIDADFDYEGQPLDENSFNMIQKGIASINEEIFTATATNDLRLRDTPELFRGMSVNDNNAENFLSELTKDGATLDTENVSSWSKMGGIAATFARQTAVSANVPIILIGSKFTEGVDMAQNETSANADEFEIAIPPSRFYVKKVQYQRSKQTGKLVGIKVNVLGLAD